VFGYRRDAPAGLCGGSQEPRDHRRLTSAAPVLLDAETAATYAGVRPATLRVWRHRYGLTSRWTRDGSSLDELAEVRARRAGELTG
jgi:hypothetical protein